MGKVVGLRKKWVLACVVGKAQGDLPLVIEIFVSVTYFDVIEE
jgi:hypothetical protein